MTDRRFPLPRGRGVTDGASAERPVRLLGAVVAVLGLVVAACGSTVEVPNQAGAPVAPGQAPPGGDQGLSAPQAPYAPDPAATAGAGGIPVEPGAPGGAQPGNPGTAGGQPGGGGQAGGQQGDDGAARPASNEPLELGVIIGEGFENVNDQLGGNLGGFGDNRRQAQALIDEINAKGGLLGRKIVPVWGVRNDNRPSSYAEQEQEICSLWTEDHDVFAAVGVVNIYDTLLSCLARAGKPFVAQHLYPYDSRQYGSYPQTFTPSMLGLDEMAQVYVDRLAAQGYFEEGGQQGPLAGTEVKVGLVRYDYPSYARVANEVLKPALQSHGIELAAEYAVTPDQSSREQGNVSAEAQNAVLQFKAEGVTHVMLLDRGAYLAVFFTQAAESQNYRPRYGLTSIDGPGIILQDTAPNQMRGALAVGWEPLMDVPIEGQPEENERAQHCKKLMEEKAGQDMSSPLTRLLAYQYCDTIWFLEQAITRGGDITMEAFIAGANRTGSSYMSPITFSTLFAPDRHYGAAAVADLAYFEECSCFQYTSEPHPLR